MGFFVRRDDHEDDGREDVDGEHEAPRLDVAKLEALGFFVHVPLADRGRVMDIVRMSGHPWAVETRRAEHADAEDLAERGVRDLLGRVAPFLRHAGVPIEVDYREARRPATRERPAGRGRARIGEDGWLDESDAPAYVERLRVALAPGDPLLEVVEDDLGISETYRLSLGGIDYPIFVDADAGDHWELATNATLGLLDRLLAAHGSPERAFALYADNDLQIVFATPDMARVIDAGVPPRERLRGVTGA